MSTLSGNAKPDQAGGSGNQPSPEHDHHTGPHAALAVGLGVAITLFVLLLLALAFMLFRRQRQQRHAGRRGESPLTASSASRVNPAGVAAGNGLGWNGGGLPQYSPSHDQVVSPPVYSSRADDMIAGLAAASGGGEEEAGEIPSKNPLP